MTASMDPPSALVVERMQLLESMIPEVNDIDPKRFLKGGYELSQK